MYPYVYEVTLKANSCYISRILRSNTNLTEKQMASYYSKFCKANNCKFAFVSCVTNNNLPVDTYDSSCPDYYEFKALCYAESRGIVSYRVKNSYMIFNQNYSNKECIGGSWVENPCTYQRTVDLDSGAVTTKKLQRLQKDGWDNV